MLAEAPLPAWATGCQVTAVGGQTPRAVDDIGFITDRGGWGMVQAKKNLRIEAGTSSPLAEALEQLIAVDDVGVPARSSHQARQLDPGRDGVLVLTDHTAPAAINRVLAPVTDRLRALPASSPVADAARNEAENRALKRLKDHLDRLWRRKHGNDLTETELRRLVRVLSVQALNFAEGGNDFYAVQSLLGRVATRPDDIPRMWLRLGREAQRLAEERTYLDRPALVDRLESDGIYLRPLARMRPDVERLQQVTRANLGAMRARLAIAAPEGPVELSRDVSAVLAAADGHLAITGEPGAGKSVILHSLAVASIGRDADVVLLRPTNLRSTAGQVRQELNLRHELEEVLSGWTGESPGLLLIDGLDQTRDTDTSAWLPDLARALMPTRWQVVATIRSFDLKHGRAWRSMFPGAPIDQRRADPGLSAVRHVVVADLTVEELEPLRTASPRLADLIDAAGNRLRDLLTNPFNLDLTAHLLQGDTTPDLSSVNTRADLLHSYWRERVEDLDMQRVLRAVVDAMLTHGRQVADPVELPPAVSSNGLEALRREGVLRDLPTSAGHPSALVEFSHPVLFDYAVAMLGLGDSSRPESLADRLDDDPNLTIRVRPSMEYRLATVWRDDLERRAFWLLSLRLTSRDGGHVLAAAAAARVAASEFRHADDVKPLADACADLGEEHDRWNRSDARGLAFLLAAAVGRSPVSEETDVALASFANELAQRAREDDDVELALLASQLPGRGLHGRLTEVNAEGAAQLVEAAITCIEMALVDLSDPPRSRLAEVAGRLLAHAAVVDPAAAAPTVRKLCEPSTLYSIGTQHMWTLIEQLPSIARKSADLAVTIGAATFEYEETRDEQTNLLASAILPLTSNRRQDLDSLRFAVGEQFKALTHVDASAATTLLLRALQATTQDRWPDRVRFAAPPHPGHSGTLRFSAGHGVLLTMTNTLLDRLVELAEDSPMSSDDTTTASLAEMIRQIVALLQHDEVWQRILLRAASRESPALAQALLPALLAPNLFAHPSTWIGAAHVARRLSPFLPADEHSRLEAAIWGMIEAQRIPGDDDPRGEERLLRRRDAILAGLDCDHIVEPRIRLRLAERAGSGEPLAVPDLDEAAVDRIGEMVWSTEEHDPESAEGLQQELSAIDQELRSDEDGARQRARQRLINLWERLPTPASQGQPVPADPFAVVVNDVRLQAAESLARQPEILPGTQVGDEVYATLKASLPSPDPTAVDEGNVESWSDSSMPSWGTSPSNSALSGLAALVRRDEWRGVHGDELVTLLRPLLDSVDPVRRFLTTRVLSALYPDQNELFEQLRTRLLTETDPHIAADLLARLSWFRAPRAREVDEVMRQLAAQPDWACAAADPEADRRMGRDERWTTAVHVLTALAVVDSAAYATSVVEAWFEDASEYPNRVASSASYLRDLLNPSDPAWRPSQGRAFQLLDRAVGGLRESWTASRRDGQATDDQQKRLRDTVTVAESIGQQVYYASGAHDDSQAQKPAPLRGDLRRFSSLALPLLERLAAIDYPAVTHRIVQTADYLGREQPRRALLVAARTVTGDGAYAHDQLALTAVHDLVRHYLAEHRDLVLNDAECMSAIREMLEAYVRLGWEKAIELAEELDDLFK
ncbi:hypothetical protein ACQPZJ_37925 [Actinoplanes sp. CA-054009]